jgi:hypothetical protein
MMKSINSVILIILNWPVLLAQPGYLVTNNRNDSLRWQTQLGNVNLSLIRGQNGFDYLFTNNAKTDSSKIGFSKFLYSPNNNKYIVYRADSEDGYDLYKVTASGKISFLLNTKTDYNYLVKDELIGVDQNSYDEPPKKKAEELSEAQMVSGGLKQDSRLIKLIVAFNVETKAKRTILDLNKLALIMPTEDIFALFVSPDQKKILLSVGEYESGDQSPDKYFLYEFESEKLEKYTLPALRKRDDKKYNELRILNGCEWFYQRKYLWVNEYILDNNFQSIGLTLNPSICSCFPVDGKADFFWFKSNLDKIVRFKPQLVLVSYRPIVEVQFNLFRIYNDSLVNKNDLTILNKDDLLLLKNMVFAKHNYKFDIEYYQAFFNLFRFYNSDRDRQKRTKEVNHLLTEMDKKNLQLIDFALSKLKK